MTTKKEWRKILKFIIHMKVVETLSKLSYDKKHQVCAMAVKKDFSDIHKFGYNGNYEGGDNKRDSMEHGMSGFLHAEDNWINFKTLDKEILKKEYILFLTMTPCDMCIKKLINAGIREICILNEYVNCGKTYDIAKNANVKIYFLKDKIKELIIKNKIDKDFYSNYLNLLNKKNPEESYLNSLGLKLKEFFDVNKTPLNKIKNLKDKINLNKNDIFESFYSDIFNILYEVL